MATSTIEQTAPSKKMASKENGSVPTHNGIPPLTAGDFLTRSEFERRYHAHPDLKKAELIEGVVYMPSPVSAQHHGDPHFNLIGWLALYGASVPGLRGSDNATLRLDNVNDPQPDALLRFDAAQGGRSRLDKDGYLEGPVEFVLEVSNSSASYDMNQKKTVYARHGIQEYLVILTQEERVVWYVLRDEGYEALVADDSGILRSETLPGLWLKESAIWENNLADLLAIVQQGIASSEHGVFIDSFTKS